MTLRVVTHLGRFSDGLLPLLQSTIPGVDFVPSRANGARDAEVLVVLVDDRDGVQDLARALSPGVRWVHVLGAGVDGLPLESLAGRTITCSRGAAAPAIAEFVLAAMLAFEKHLPDSWIDAPPEYWGAAGLGTLRGGTAGLVGIGAIGTEVARRAVAFDMRVVAVRRTAAPADIDGVEVLGSLHDLLATSDHVIVAAPATPSTRHLLDESAFAAIKRGAHLVNVARGALVDQEALLEALDDGRVARATLDVTDPEPLPEGHPLYAHPKVRVSPHISWSSPDTIRLTIALFAENLRRYTAGEPLGGMVDAAAGY